MLDSGFAVTDYCSGSIEVERRKWFFVTPPLFAYNAAIFLEILHSLGKRHE